MDSSSGAPKGASKGGGASSLDAGEDSESESESSSSSSSPPASNQGRVRTVSEELESFRNQWKEELKKAPPVPSSSTTGRNRTISVSKQQSEEPSPSPSDTDMKVLIKNRGGKVEGVSVEEQAKHWFLEGVGLEQKGELYDAVKCYRRAVQLVPDIEVRVGSGTNPAVTASENSSSVGTPLDSDEENDAEIEDENEDNYGTLNEKFLKIIEARGWEFFVKAKQDDKIHLNNIPVEVLTYILRWLVSNDLDVRSLDLLSNTCRGFYCLCRDEKIWEMACEKVWSDLGEEEAVVEYSSYREMFLKRPRVRFDGCYICKVTYIRPGEHSFQDQSYRPWHFVEYYRFIRFLPNGEILFLTTSDEPNVSVSGLRDAKYPRNPATMRGHYHLYGNNIVSAVVKKPVTSQPTPVHRSRNARIQTQEITTFHMEFEISPMKSRSNWMLKWLQYSVYISRCPIGTNKNMNRNQALDNDNPRVTSSTFDLNPNKFPPLYFSRVKSYTQKSEGIL